MLKGPDHHRWKGGRSQHGEGYILIYKPNHHFVNQNGYILEHRLIWEEYHKAILLPWAIVHHINGNKQDNRIENLEVMSISDHSIHHNPKKDMANRICADCGSTKSQIDSKGYHKWCKNPLNAQQFLCIKCSMRRRRC